jgi:GNAT superfamily N-acetyltransferase
MRKLTFEVRHVAADDVEALQRLFVEASAKECAVLAADAEGAVVAVDPSGDVVGVARWHRLGATSSEAEVAVYVSDSWRGAGVGGALVVAVEGVAASLGMHVSTSTLLGDAA